VFIKTVDKQDERYLGIWDANAGNKGDAGRFYKDILNTGYHCLKVADPKIIGDFGEKPSRFSRRHANYRSH